MAFKKRDRSLREIGAALGAASILDGSIRRAGNRVRIVAQLVDARTEEHLWADTYDRDLTDIFAIQTDVAMQIAAALQAELSTDEVARIEQKPTANSHAYALYLKGRHAYNRATEEGYRQAIACFEQAITEDPKLAVAYATLALTHAEMAAQGFGSPSAAIALQKAREGARKALALDPDLGDAHCVAGAVLFMNDFDWVGAEKEFRRALEVSPGNSDIYDKYGWMCSAMGRSEDALRLFRQARELDPLAHGSDVATELVRAGRYAEALDAARRYVQLEPGQIRGHSLVGWTQILMGDLERGLPSLENAVTLSARSTLFLGQLGQAYAMAGQTERARGILQELHARSRDGSVSPYHFAYVHTGLGEREEAIGWLEKAFEERTGAIYGIKGSFLFKPLHGHPRFQALLAKMNLA
jgi:tetratricopeptide (TPR) repeat protein